ncbi:MAG: ribonuclease III [Candidatus Pacebacteria bacterium]|nr:ribonuclease III [Candidatus Paceibacterota bacterium]MBP9701096.1 ribonuclease III [Candidatus Paceibacterota bacterium]
MKDFSTFEQAIGVTFKDKTILTQAFIHRSYINENPRSGLEHNERLEFLGDAVIELVVTDYLYRNHPTQHEGDLTAYRSALVNAVIMGEVASSLNMNDYLLLSKGEQKDTGRARQTILANTYESFVGALYLDQGYASCDVFVTKTLLTRLDDIIKTKSWKDAKSQIQEEAQERLGVTPSYKVIGEVGPDHDKHFTIGVFFGDKKIAEGKGKSKQEGEQQAALAALEAKGWL